MSAGDRTLSATERALLLAEAALAASAGAGDTAALGAFMEKALAPLGAQAGVAWLAGPGGSALRFEPRALRFRAPLPARLLAELAAARITHGTGMAGEAWRRGRCRAGPTASRRAPWDKAASDAGFGFCATLPVFIEGRGPAVLQFYARAGAAFTADLPARLDRLTQGLGALLGRKRLEELRRKSLLSNLHDDVGQTLAGLALLAHAFHRSPGRSALKQRAAQLSRLANEATAKVRALAASVESSSPG
jgi:signal transduction histidine kinase